MIRRRARNRWPTSATAATAALVVLLAAAVLIADGRRDGTGEQTTEAVGPTTTTPATTTLEPPATAAPPSTTTAPASTDTTRTDLPITLPDVTATALVERLVVAEPDPAAPPYVRDLFDGGGWAYDPTTGCNTRERVLIEESSVPPTVDDRCRSTGGRWRSPYDGLETGDPADLEIDHLVPLADAWRAGAWRWSSDLRLAFANDLTSPDTLVAVSASSNRSKGDSTPDQWLPPARSGWCEYASAWVRVKVRWALEVTPAEKATLVSVLGGC